MKRVMLSWSVALCSACSSAPHQDQPPNVPVVAIQDEGGTDVPTTPPEVFACRPGRVGDQAEIELRVRSLTGNSEDERRSRAAYTIRILALSQGEVSRAEVTLTSLEPEQFSDGRQQMAWHTALEQGWIERAHPFELSKAGTMPGWCLAEAGTCKASDAAQNEFANALGESLALVKRPELEAQLEGKSNDGELELELSEALRKRASLGVVDGQTAKAAQQGGQFPAVFRFPLHASSRGDSETDKEVAAKLKIDRACRLLSLTTILRTDQSNYVGLHELTWSITPEW